MNDENKISRLLTIVLAILAMAMLFMIVADRGKTGPQPAGGRNAVERIIDAFRQKFNVRSPGMTDDELRQKARQYLK